MRSLAPLLSLAALARASPVDTSLLTRQETLNACLEAAELSYVDINSEDWEDAIVPHNLRVPVVPRAVVYATATEQIQAAVKCAVESEIHVSAKSGGHSYASMGLGGEDGSLVIQLDHWHDVTLREDNTAVVSAGTRLGVVALELYAQGKRGISHGTCPSVGVGGHVVHGGYGFSSHTHGLALDAVVGANVVLADGSLVHASETENTDLFWALRGGGSSFGIVAEFEFDTFDVSHNFSYFSIDSDISKATAEDAAASLLAFQDALEEGLLDRKLNMRLELGRPKVTVEVVYHGAKEDGRKALEPFDDILGLNWKSNRTRANEADWLTMLESWTYGDPLNITYPYEGHDNAYTSSLVTRHIPEEAMTSFMTYWKEVGQDKETLNWWLQMDVHGDANSRISEVESDSTAYSHRDKLWLFQFSSPLSPFDPDLEGAFALVNGYMDSIKDNLEDGEWGRYANYIDSELSREDAQVQYWSDHLEKLQAIKSELDPTQVFYNPQSIDPAAAE